MIGTTNLVSFSVNEAMPVATTFMSGPMTFTPENLMLTSSENLRASSVGATATVASAPGTETARWPCPLATVANPVAMNTLTEPALRILLIIASYRSLKIFLMMDYSGIMAEIPRNAVVCM